MRGGDDRVKADVVRIEREATCFSVGFAFGVVAALIVVLFKGW